MLLQFPQGNLEPPDISVLGLLLFFKLLSVLNVLFKLFLINVLILSLGLPKYVRLLNLTIESVMSGYTWPYALLNHRLCLNFL